MSKRKSRVSRLTDLFFIIALLVGGLGTVVFFKPSFLVATFIFFGIPSIYLLWRKPSMLKKAALAGVLFGLIWGFAFDYLAEFNHAWGWSSNTSLAFPVQFFGTVSLDILIWYFLWIFFIVAFYEYFAEHDRSLKISKNTGWSVACGLAAIGLVVWAGKAAPNLITFTYPYMVLGLFALAVSSFIIWRKPRLFSKVVGIAPFFIMVYLCFELAALQTNLWSFPGNYIGTVSVFGLTFPFEELFFWILSSSTAAAAYYEYFIDDGK